MTTPHVSLLRALRDLVPQRPLSTSEALRITELQALRLRELLEVGSDELPDDALSSVPRIEVTYEPDLPVSGLAQWHNGRWVVALNGSEPWTRQRFSLAHELSHIVNHATKQWLHPADRFTSGHDKGERLADYFAGVALMPKHLVKRYVGRGERLSQLARRFGVSSRAMGVRLNQLGLTEPTPRCRRPETSYRRIVRPFSQPTIKEPAA